MPSLLEALERKYFADRSPDGDDGEVEGMSKDVSGRLISIFVPRLPPLLCVPELLVLNDCDIDCAGDVETIKDKCCRVRELDLAQNKLQDWHEVFHIVEHMPRIEFLNLSKNHLSGTISKNCAPSITNLRGIVLNSTYLEWQCVNVLLENLPVLEELHLSLNDYQEVLLDTVDFIPAPPTSCEPYCDISHTSDTSTGSQNEQTLIKRCKRISPHKALKTLHFTGNPVEHWFQICRLGRIFPNLESLVLADCPIKAIDVRNGVSATAEGENDTTTSHSRESDDTSQRYFSNLLFLNLSCTNINAWDDIDRLALFPKLRSLRVNHWPLWEHLESTEHERRQLLIARLPNISILNGGGAITADEREDAERAFIRHYMEKPEWERPKRYEELVAKHGKLNPLVNVSLKPNKKVKVFLTFREKTETRLVDIYRTVSDLKSKLAAIVGLPANKMRLFYLDQDYKEFGPEEMRFPNKFLYSYNIQAGDEIIVDEKK